MAINQHFIRLKQPNVVKMYKAKCIGNCLLKGAKLIQWNPT